MVEQAGNAFYSVLNSRIRQIGFVHGPNLELILLVINLNWVKTRFLVNMKSTDMLGRDSIRRDALSIHQGRGSQSVTT